MKQNIKNVFKDLKKDERVDDIIKGIEVDMAHSNNFSILKLVKESNDQDNCFGVLLDNIDIIRGFYRQCQNGSKQFP